jgi:hypothetical protein
VCQTGITKRKPLSYVESEISVLDLMCSRSSLLNVTVARPVSGRDPASIDRKSDAVDEAGIITCEEDDRRSKFLGLSYATCWC